MRFQPSAIAFAFSCAALSAFQTAPSQAQEARYDQLATAPFDKDFPTPETARALRNELLFQRATQAYLWALPAVNMWAMKEGSEKVFGSGYNVLPVWKERIKASTLVTTPNSDVVYAMGYLDLHKDGPLVVEVPPGVQGMFDDFFQRPLKGPTMGGRTWVGDVGLAGPDKGKGGTYVLLPPDYQGAPPKGTPHDAFIYKSRTYNVFLFWRTFFKDPQDLSKPNEEIQATRIYPVGQKATAKAMQFPDANLKPADLLFPQDAVYFDMLSRFIESEYVDPADLDMRGFLHTIGIEKGKSFAPPPEMRTLLDKAANTGFRISKVVIADMLVHEPGGKYYSDRQWLNVFAGEDTGFQSSRTFTNLEQRSGYFTSAYSASPGMVKNLVGMGAKYPVTSRDKDGNFLDGGHSYSLHLPPNIPAKNFWSATVYDGTTASGLDNGQPHPSLNQMDKPQYNPDGSLDLYFGPEAPVGKEKNWLRTVPDKGYFVIFRLYSPQQAFFDQSWKPGDLVKTN
jgi:hypothetical protein